MDESLGSQFALQVALQTLKERCQHFQQRLTILEEENITLRLQSAQMNDTNDESLSEIDKLKSKVAELTEQKSQLRNNVLMVATENRQLWGRLSKLTQVNKNLGTQLNKINDTITLHSIKAHIPLIRSKTFTQNEPQTKLLQRTLVDENGKISLELEDISLKLLSTINKEKSELELQCSEMAELQNNEILTNSFGFAYPGDDLDVDDSMADELEQHLNDLKCIKESLNSEKQKMIKNINNLKAMKVESVCKKCADNKRDNISKTMIIPECDEEIKNEDVDINQQLDSLARWGTPENSGTFLMKEGKTTENVNKMYCICPICNRTFSKNEPFDIFEKHVENHFLLEPNVETF